MTLHRLFTYSFDPHRALLCNPTGFPIRFYHFCDDSSLVKMYQRPLVRWYPGPGVTKIVLFFTLVMDAIVQPGDLRN
jgi:hypothetical protein